MPAPVIPPRECLIPLLQVNTKVGKLHCTASQGMVKDQLASSLSNLALFILAQECLPL